MLALRLLVTATLTAWAVTTCTPEITNKLSNNPSEMKEHCILYNSKSLKKFAVLHDCDFYIVTPSLRSSVVLLRVTRGFYYN